MTTSIKASRLVKPLKVVRASKAGKTVSAEKTITRAWDPANYLLDEEECALYLDTIIREADGDDKLIAAALGDVARAHGMMRVSRTSGLAREALYRSLSAKGNPSFGTVLKVLTALGLELSVKPLQASNA